MATKASINQVRTVNGSFNLLVLVSGTVDPANLYSDEDLRSQSYGLLPKRYWSDEFRKEIDILDEEYVNLVTFPFHGWSGNNNKDNRQNAGAYLVNRLCGANGEKPFYKDSYQNKPIYFHLLGHSHGGNVINEMTKQIQALGDEWPSAWKIKSITYLSTPFFENLHQVNVSKSFFHKEAEVLSLYNEFDLTQRVLADFSLYNLFNESIKLDSSDLKNSMLKLMEYINSYPIEILTQGFSNLMFAISPGYEIYQYNKMSYENGIILYDDTRKILNQIKEVLSNTLNLLEQLNIVKTPYIKYDKLKDEQKEIIPNSEYKKIVKVIDTLQIDLNKLIEELNIQINDNTNKDSFSKLTYINTLVDGSELLINLEKFLDIKPDTLVGDDGSFWNILYNILDFNIDSFDNTYQTPDIQYENSFLKDKITNLDITKYDIYGVKKESKNYDRFIKYIENIERRYKNYPNQYNLLDLLFTLLSCEKMTMGFVDTLPTIIDYLDKYEYIATGERDKIIKGFKQVLINIKDIFSQRYFDGLIDKSDNDNSTFQRGSLAYFLIKSHSLSKDTLYNQVKTFIKENGVNL